MIKAAIIIPFYQRTPGILRRTLDSVVKQHLGPTLTVTVIVIDDGSPVAVEQEVAGLALPDRMVLTIIKQNNGGVSKARNTGLASVNDSFRYIAFLDSDDIWDAGHLDQGIMALELGSDFYFCDHSREGHHQSHFATCSTLQSLHIKRPENVGLVFRLTTEEAITTILKDFVCQASTTIFRRTIAPDLRFNVAQRNAGEDMLFFLAIAFSAHSVCMSARQLVHCGRGINIYYDQLKWNADGFLSRLVENRESHILIQKTFQLSHKDADWNRSHIDKLQKDIAFHSLRRFVRAKGKWPAEFHSLASRENNFTRWFAVAVLQVSIGILLRRYKPE